MVAECNRIAGEERWTLADRWDPQASLAMARAFMARQMERGVTDPVELVCRWNRPDGSARAGYRARAEREVKRFSTREGGAR